jgi:hypothetical protein
MVKKERRTDKDMLPPAQASLAEPHSRTHARSPGARRKRSFFFRTRRRTIITILLLTPLFLCLSYWLVGTIALADTASLYEMKGIVQTRREDEAQWEPAHTNQLLGRKDRIRTKDGSSARLLFFDVSSVDLDENTEVSITRVAKRRGGSAVDVILKTWVGKTTVRAVRFVDPSSSFRMDTPTASTVVRGARFTVEVKEEGTTQIELEEGTAKVQVGDKKELITIETGERFTLQPDGVYQVEQVFAPDPQPMYAKVGEAWYAPDETLRLELTETEVNLFLAAVSDEQPDFMFQDTQVWFIDGEARLATTVVQPKPFDLSAAFDVKVVDGRLEPQMKSVAAGIALPLPARILDMAVETVMKQMEGYLRQAYDYVEFDDVQIQDGFVLIVGRKQPDAPVGQ